MSADPMWCLVLFDLPTLTTEQRRDYSKFRHCLLDNGFSQIQLSVYAKYCPAGTVGVSTLKTVKSMLPPQGEVRFLYVTERQWANMVRIFNAEAYETEPAPDILLFF